MPKHIDESLSALVDGEVDELELRRILNTCDKDPTVYESWRRMQLVRGILNDEAVSNVDLSAGIRQALDGVPMDEVPAELKQDVSLPVSSASFSTSTEVNVLSRHSNHRPKAKLDEGVDTDCEGAGSATPSGAATLGFATLAKISSVAAMVGFVSATLALVVVDKLQSDTVAVIAASNSANASQVVSGRLAEVGSVSGNSGLGSIPVSDSRLDDQLNAYLLQHAEFSSINTGRGLMHFARIEGWQADTKNK